MMPRDWRHGLARRALGLLALLPALASCADGALAPAAPVARLQVHALTPATVRTLVVEVSGPGLDPAQLVNLPVDADGVASGTIATTAGSGRRIVITALDTAGAATHRGDTTVTLVAGTNPPLALVLRPLAAVVGITVTFGDVRAVRTRDEEPLQ